MSMVLLRFTNELTIYRVFFFKLGSNCDSFFHLVDQFKVFDTKIGRIGLFICYDAFFPEAARSLAIQGVDLLVNSTNWEKPYDYDIAKQMKHDYYTMLTERRPDVYIA